jgi:hypothetical protein
MRSVCDPTELSMRLLRLEQWCEAWAVFSDRAVVSHALRIHNLHPAHKQEVGFAYDSDSEAVGFCECAQRATCVTDHRTRERKLRTRGIYWHGDRKTLLTPITWFLDAAEIDFTLTVTVESRVHDGIRNVQGPADSGIMNTYSDRNP